MLHNMTCLFVVLIVISTCYQFDQFRCTGYGCLSPARQSTSNAGTFQGNHWNWIRNRKCEDCDICQILTGHGYEEVQSKKTTHDGKCKYFKARLNIMFLGIIFIHLACVVLKKKTIFAITVWILLTYSSDCYGCGLYDHSIVLFYLLIIGGIELNPGPPKSNTNEPQKKRVRKSGKSYCTYLTARNSLGNAPHYVQQRLAEITTQRADQIETTVNIHEHSSASTSYSDIEMETDHHQMPQNQQPLQQQTITDSDSESVNSVNSNLCSEDEDSEYALTTPSDSSDDQKDPEDEEKDTNILPSDPGIKFEDIPVYDGARITTGASMLLHITFALEENLTGTALTKLLGLTEIHCKENNTIPTSIHIFKKWFKDLKIPPKKHMYCSACLLSVENETDKCPNPLCGISFRKKENKSFFVEISIIEQLKKLFHDKTFRENIMFRFKREKKHCDNIEDIYDGKHYKSFSNILSCPNNISLIWNTDGIPLFNSSQVSLWPLYFAINELPFKLRRDPKNLLLAGLWIGPKKPQMLTFLKPFINDLEILENGFEIKTDVQEIITVKGMLIAGTADLPAKSAVCNIVQYNGKYSCPLCLQPGQTAKAGKGSCHVFPFQFDNPLGPKRTHEQSMDLAQTATDTGNNTCGIKGPCWFTSLKMYDFVIGNCTDYMHCVLLGVTKRLTSLWFSKEHSGKKFNVFNGLEKINDRLNDLKPPLTIRRMPRSINDLKYWKASEYRSWLLFYAPVLLLDILEKEYYEHFLLLSNGIFLLLQESVSTNDVKTAENFLEHFVARYSDLYEERYLTLNVHLLLHLPENVEQLGPLWAYSCFPFEDANGYLLKLIKGTQSVESQITDTIAVIHGIPFLENHCIDPGSKEEELLRKMQNMTFKNTYKLEDDIFALGKITEIQTHSLSQEYYVAIATYINKPLNGIIKKFKRLKLKAKVYHSLEYTRAKVRNSYTIKYVSKISGLECYGLVKTYFQYVHISKEITNLAMVTPLTHNNDDEHCFPFDDVTEQRLMPHFAICNVPNLCCQPVAIDVKNILDVCVMMENGKHNLVYVCSAPNLLEKD